jgi:hypothetical protein
MQTLPDVPSPSALAAPLRARDQKGLPLPQRTGSVLINFLSLSRNIRNNIYRRGLVVAHPLYLFQGTGSQVVDSFAPENPF